MSREQPARGVEPLNSRASEKVERDFCAGKVKVPLSFSSKNPKSRPGEAPVARSCPHANRTLLTYPYENRPFFDVKRHFGFNRNALLFVYITDSDDSIPNQHCKCKSIFQKSKGTAQINAVLTHKVEL